MSEITLGIVSILFFILLMMLKMPISFAMGVSGFVCFSYMVSTEAAFRLLATDFVSTFMGYHLSTIPLFVFMGFLCYASGIGSRLYYAVYRWVGHLPGGLAIATVWACAGFGAICGSALATGAAIGTTAIPEMRKYQYDPGLATASVAAGCLQGVVIPPSLILVIYGIMVRESISRLFMAAIIPGVLLAAVCMVTINILTYLNPRLGPRGPRSTWKERLTSLGMVWEVVTLFAMVMGGLFSGIFTPTEAGAVGSFGAFLIGLVRRRLSWPLLMDAVFQTLRTSCMIYVMIAGAMIFNHLFVVTNIATIVGNWIAGLPLPPFGIWMMVFLLYLACGCILDTLAVTLITIPIFVPVAINLGYDVVWFGIFQLVALNIGLLTPPVGLSCFVIKGVAPDVPLETIFKGVVPFIISLSIGTIILTAWPEITMFLPNLLK